MSENTEALSSCPARLYLAAICPWDEIEDRMPRTVGDMNKELTRRKIITPLKDAQSRVTKKYRPKNVRLLRSLIRLEWADELISADSSNPGSNAN